MEVQDQVGKKWRPIWTLKAKWTGMWLKWWRTWVLKFKPQYHKRKKNYMVLLTFFSPPPPHPPIPFPFADSLWCSFFSDVAIHITPDPLGNLTMNQLRARTIDLSGWGVISLATAQRKPWALRSWSVKEILVKWETWECRRSEQTEEDLDWVNKSTSHKGKGIGGR
jgi:hypothetical protein